MALQTFWTKRRFGVTPEPRGKSGKRGGNVRQNGDRFLDGDCPTLLRQPISKRHVG